MTGFESLLLFSNNNNNEQLTILLTIQTFKFKPIRQITFFKLDHYFWLCVSSCQAELFERLLYL